MRKWKALESRPMRDAGWKLCISLWRKARGYHKTALVKWWIALKRSEQKHQVQATSITSNGRQIRNEIWGLECAVFGYHPFFFGKKSWHGSRCNHLAVSGMNSFPETVGSFPSHKCSWCEMNDFAACNERKAVQPGSGAAADKFRRIFG